MSGIFKHFKRIPKDAQNHPIASPPEKSSSSKSISTAVEATTSVNHSPQSSSSESDVSMSTCSMMSTSSAMQTDVEIAGSVLSCLPKECDIFFANNRAPSQPVLEEYPHTYFGQTKRRFSKGWFNDFKWLEYNEKTDSAFCFPCRVFLANSPETIFTETGFRDWKNARFSLKQKVGKKGRGLDLHANSKSHKDAMLLWADRKKRDSNSSTVENQLFKITSDQQRWLLAVFCVTRFLAANGLPFRGDEDGDLDGDGKGTGLFQCVFSQLLFELEPKWKDIYKNMPGNAKYTSSDIQNETISVLADLVKRTISDEVRSAELYTIMADGTTDKNRVEVQGLVCRYLSSTGIKEHCVDMQGVKDRSAKGVFAFIKESLEKWELSFNGIVSQSYDGASVMSGQYNGLQALISQYTEREIIYVHCFLHKISLVVVKVMEQIPEIAEYFDTAQAMYNFFKKAAVLSFYEGSSLKRLIETRWSGHHDSVKHIKVNFSEITQALAGVAPSKKLDSEGRAIATGLLNQMCGNDDIFIFLTSMLNEILGPVNRIVKQLQSSTENIVSALSVISSVRCELRKDREILSDEVCDKMVSEMKDCGDIVEVETKIKRKKSRTPRMTTSSHKDYLITGLLPSDKEEDRSKKQIYAETLDLIENEFDRRFASNNTTLWKAMEVLHPSAEMFLDADVLKPLFTYAKSIPFVKESFAKSNLNVEDLKAECKIFSRVLLEKDWPRNEHGRIDLVDVALHVLSEHGKTAPVLSTLYRVGVTAGFTSTQVECLFSALSRVDRAQRKSMKTKRECELSYLAFESSVLLKEITFDVFLKEWKQKPRHLFNI